MDAMRKDDMSLTVRLSIETAADTLEEAMWLGQRSGSLRGQPS
jgi:hypothetical protein